MKNILITGSSGFLGLSIIKNLSEYKVISLARTNADILADLTVRIPALPAVDMVIHCAGKAHSVPRTDTEKRSFYEVNVGGTQNLLRSLERLTVLPQSFVFVSSVAVYGLIEGTLINEDAPLLALDPYGKSKIQAEQLIKTWCKKNNVICTILRLPLLAGSNPPGNLGAMINGIKKGYYFNIAGGRAKKSIVLATDVAKIIPIAAEIGGVYNLTDSYNPSFFELSSVISSQLDRPVPLNVSYGMAKCLALIGDWLGKRSPINSDKLKKITSDLTFDDTKARNRLGWKPIPVLEGLQL